MNFINRNKGTIIVIAIFLVGVLLLAQVKNIFFPDDNGALYGTRLTGIEEVKLTNNHEDQIEASLEEYAESENLED